MSPTSYRTAPPRVTIDDRTSIVAYVPNNVLGPSRLPTYADAERAAVELDGVAHRTPIFT